MIVPNTVFESHKSWWLKSMPDNKRNLGGISSTAHAMRHYDGMQQLKVTLKSAQSVLLPRMDAPQVI